MKGSYKTKKKVIIETIKTVKKKKKCREAKLLLFVELEHINDSGEASTRTKFSVSVLLSIDEVAIFEGLHRAQAPSESSRDKFNALKGMMPNQIEDY